jgi:hypothetical protein
MSQLTKSLTAEELVNYLNKQSPEVKENIINFLKNLKNLILETKGSRTDLNKINEVLNHFEEDVFDRMKRITDKAAECTTIEAMLREESDE